MSPDVQVSHLGKTFADGTVALSDVSLDVAAGSFVTLLGPSGCGKSTLLRIIADLAQATSGTVTGPVQRGGSGSVGYVFQDATLMPWASIADNVALPFQLAGQDPRGRIDDALERVGLGAFAQAYPRQLSGGMKMRASLARALVTRPRLLLMDEPFGALDEITREDLNDDLLRLWQDARMTALFVTHSVSEAVFLSERVVVMSARPGRIFADLAINEPYPRTPAFRESDAFATHCRQVSETLRAARGLEPSR